MGVASLNQDCHCVTLDTASLQASLRAAVDDLVDVPTFFAPYGVYLNAAQQSALQEAVTTLQRVAQLPGFVRAVAAEQGAGLPQAGTHGVFMGYDFHFDGDTPRLIEINTNAGGALLNAVLLAHQQVCCDLMQGFSPSQFCTGGARNCFLEMFRAEWHAAGRSGEPRRVAIVDDSPAGQFLYPEFLLFRKLFESAGWQAEIVDPAGLQRADGRLLLRGAPVDLVYNRLTDFDLREPAHATLEAAWRAGECVLTPDPWHHALHADKRNLVWLSDPHWLAQAGASAADRALLARIVPASVRVTAAGADALWHVRKQYFFKPFRGYGSRAAYRGDKLTRGKWEDIVASGDYVAQSYAPPGERRVRVDGALHDMKFDVRCYAYNGQVLLMAARVYQGQTTNMRTQGGGFAPVFAPAPLPDVAAVPALATVV